MDELAGTYMNPEASVVGVPFATGKSIIKGWLEKGHLSSWKLTSGCKWSKQLME